MAFVIAEPCIGVKDKACIDVCPMGVLSFSLENVAAKSAHPALPIIL